MADVKTHLRELSVATTVGLLRDNVNFDEKDLYNSKKFFEYATNVIYNKIDNAKNILDYGVFPDNLQAIIRNGYKLGNIIYKSQHFHIDRNTIIQWLGNDTQKGDPIDVQVGNYGFSLKEESFILKNMGLYQLFNNLTSSRYKSGLHVFKYFALKEYDAWFNYSWSFFIKYLQNKNWKHKKCKDESEACLSTERVILKFNEEISFVPINIKNNDDFMKYTSSKTREKVFCKWINEVISNDSEYKKKKKECSEVAGKAVSKKINDEFCQDNVYDFFQIYEKEYYYAKTTNTERTILRVPGKSDFTSVIKFSKCSYDVPASQLNIKTEFINKKTKKTITFRNECRFSHGQFNGTPEAKMYVERNSSLLDLYEPINI